MEGGGLFKTSKHPTTCALHVGFKAASMFMFAFGEWIFGSGDFVFTFATTTVLLAMDFWCVKRLSGPKLVGLKWESVTDERNESHWVFASNTSETNINGTDKTVFWTGIVVWPLLWFTLTFFYFIKFDWTWMALTLMAATLGAANFVGYWKCSSESKQKLQQFASSSFFKAILARASTIVL